MKGGKHTLKDASRADVDEAPRTAKTTKLGSFRPPNEATADAFRGAAQGRLSLGVSTVSRMHILSPVPA